MSQGQGPSPTPDMGQQLFARQGGASSPKGAPVNHGEDDLFKLVKDGMDSSVSMLKALPLIGSILSRILPSDAGSVSVFKSFESQGFLAGNIVRTSGGIGNGAVGNFLANLAKNGRQLHDATGGISASPIAGLSASAMMDSMQSPSRASLGSMSPPDTPGMGMGRSRGGGEMAMA